MSSPERPDRRPSTRQEGLSESVQYYVAVPGLPGAELALVAARGAVLAHLRYRLHPGYARWHRGSMAKVVLRAATEEIAALARSHDGLAIPEPPDDPVVAVFRPRPRSRAGFLSHLKLYSGRLGRSALPDWPASGLHVPLLINGDLDLSAGKAAAQAAHAILALEEARGSSTEWRDWLAAGLPLAVLRMPESVLSRVVAAGEAFGVEDEGRTEIPTGSLTAAAALPGELGRWRDRPDVDLLAFS